MTPRSFSTGVGALVFLLASAPIPLAFSQKATSPKTPAPQADASYQQGMAAINRGNLQSARAAFEQAVKLAPESPEAHNSLGWVLLQQGHAAEAVDQLKIAIKLRQKFLL